MKHFFMLAIVWIAGISAASAYCRAPGRAPEPPSSFSKPRLPNCLADAYYNRDNDCEPRVLDRYRVEVDEYIRELEDYAEEARSYAEAAERYARCEADELRKTTR